MTITNKEFRFAMAKAGLSNIQLEKADGYFYIWDDGEVCASLYSTAIYVCSFNEMSVNAWVNEILNLLNAE